MQATESKPIELTDEEQKLVSEGFTHRVTAWVHPKRGGDDYCFTLYMKGKPTDEEIVKLLKRKGSAVTNDYSIESLTPESVDQAPESTMKKTESQPDQAEKEATETETDEVPGSGGTGEEAGDYWVYVKGIPDDPDLVMIVEAPNSMQARRVAKRMVQRERSIEGLTFSAEKI